MRAMTFDEATFDVPRTSRLADRPSRRRLWTGRALSGLAALFLTFDGVMKVLLVAPVVKATRELGFPVAAVFWVGVVLLACLAVYLIPRTAVAGAVLLTGFLGGAVATNVHVGRDDVVAAVSVLDDPDTRACVVAERSLLAALEAGCTAPVGALAEVVEGDDGLELSLRAFAGTEDGSVEVRRSLVGPYGEPEVLGSRLARILLEDGAADVQIATTSAGPAPDHAPHQPEQVS